MADSWVNRNSFIHVGNVSENPPGLKRALKTPTDPKLGDGGASRADGNRVRGRDPTGLYARDGPPPVAVAPG